MNFNKAGLKKEVTYKASRSGGKGGQNVNKVSTKVELLFNIGQSSFLTESEKALLHSKLANRLNKDDYLQVISEEERSQLMNKEHALNKMYTLIVRALHQPKLRRPTKVSKTAHAKRMDQKRIQSVKKQLRSGNRSDE